MTKAYVRAVAFVLGGAILAVIVRTIVPQQDPSIFFVTAVLLSAVTGGGSAGVVAAIVSVLIFDFFFTIPHYSLRMTNPEDLAYAWPGNVRELVNVLERALVLSSADVITPSVLPDHLLAPPAAAGVRPGGAMSLEELERAHVQEVLRTSTTLEEAAARLGINPTTLWRKRRRWGLE